MERHASSSVDSVENLEQAEVLHINQSADLIQPSEVRVSDTMVMVEQAQPVLTNQGTFCYFLRVRLWQCYRVICLSVRAATFEAIDLEASFWYGGRSLPYQGQI